MIYIKKNKKLLTCSSFGNCPSLQWRLYYILDAFCLLLFFSLQFTLPALISVFAQFSSSLRNQLYQFPISYYAILFLTFQSKLSVKIKILLLMLVNFLVIPTLLSSSIFDLPIVCLLLDFYIWTILLFLLSSSIPNTSDHYGPTVFYVHY